MIYELYTFAPEETYVREGLLSVNELRGAILSIAAPDMPGEAAVSGSESEIILETICDQIVRSHFAAKAAAVVRAMSTAGYWASRFSYDET